MHGSQVSVCLRHLSPICYTQADAGLCSNFCAYPQNFLKPFACSPLKSQDYVCHLSAAFSHFARLAVVNTSNVTSKVIVSARALTLRNLSGAQLPQLGINQQFISFLNVTMESEKYICVRETGAQNSVVIVDMASPLTPLKRPITADSALMNPVSKVIALKAKVAGTAGDSLQIFNLELKSKMKSFQITQPVDFWKWITPTKLGLVTQSTVYHWDMNVSHSYPVACKDCPELHV